jgi:uncharacterized protein (TIGR02453 family)
MSLRKAQGSRTPRWLSVPKPPEPRSGSCGERGWCRCHLLDVRRLCHSVAMEAAGIPLGAVEFFAELEQNNDRDWWAAHKSRWQAEVREPLQWLVDQLEGEFGQAKLFRPHRDVRFSLDKSPYKTHQGAVVTTSPGVGYYVQVSSGGLMTGAGWYQPSPAQIAAYREAVLDDRSGPSLERAVTALTEAGYEISGDQLKTAPRGVDPGHPRVALLRHRSLLAASDKGMPSWMATPEATERVRLDWQRCRTLVNWLGENL